MPRAVAPPTDEQVLLATTEGAPPVTTEEDIFFATGQTPGVDANGRKDRGKIEHQTLPRVRMYKPVGDGTYVPRAVPSQNLKVVLREGFLAACPDCHTNICEGPNHCTGRERAASRICPACSKRIYDNPNERAVGEDGSEAEDDPTIIRDDAYGSSTPASRTKAKLDRHILAYHPEEAGYLGVSPTAQPVRIGQPVAFEQRVVEQAGV